jgi:hypothetical protein
MQRPPQLVVPVGHVQAPLVHDAPPAQTLPHAPQLLLFVESTTHAPPQLVSPGSHVHTPLAQYEPPKHTVPHAPQLELSSARFVHVPLHSLVPVGQLLWQKPSTHVCAAVHEMPQPPQLPGSSSGLTQPPAHGVRPPEQRHAPPTHDWPAAQL